MEAKEMKKRNMILIGSVAIIVIFILIIIVRAFTVSPEPVIVANTPDLQFQDGGALQRLSKALQYQTISYQDENQKSELEFLEFHEYLEKTFPYLHKTLKREIINKLSLLYRWDGTDKDSTPILLMAHMDVVPAELAQGWKYPPFSGTIAGGFVWGRGALDMKSQLLGILEAIEELVKKGYQPEKTIYIAMGHDEELSGKSGNGQIVSYLQSKGIKLGLVLDEGEFIYRNMVLGIKSPVAPVGMVEKGCVTLELTVNEKAGHSSMPPRHTAIGKLAAIICKLEDNPFPESMDEMMKKFFEALAPQMPAIERMVFANVWVFKPLILGNLAQSPETDSFIRTTTAATIFQSGDKDNVLPQQAKAMINFRIIPGETVDSVFAHVKKVIGNEPVDVKIVGDSWNPSKISSCNSHEFKIVKQCIKDVFPGAVPAPCIVPGATDSRFYQELSNTIYKFSPIEIDSDLSKTIHGVNERIGIKSYQSAIQFYYDLIQHF
jgi:carboxypeptidase PM20D1